MKNKFWILILTLSFLGNLSLAQAQELPVIVETNANAKAMLLIDDSGSMNAVLEHEEFDPTSAVATDSSKDIPSIIFKLNSGTSAPTTSQTLTPVLIEYNIGLQSSGSSPGDLFAGKQFSSATTLPLISYVTCNNLSGNQTNCPSPGTATPKLGVNTAMLYGNSSITGSSIFTLSNLASSGGSYLTDSNGNEFLYVNYRKNDWHRFTDTWQDVWAKFDESGNLQTVHTRVFTTPGATIKFNGVEAFLSAGWYRIEYLRWIFYSATPTQRASLPGLNRLQAVKNVVQSLIVNNPSVKFGLASLNGADFQGSHSGNLSSQWYTPEGNANNTKPRIRNAIGTPQATLLSSLNTMTPKGGTPLAYSYIETLRYFHGESANDGQCNPCQYSSPITSACDAHFVVLLTDGLPTGESNNSFFGSWVKDYDGDGAEGAGTNQNCQATSSALCASFADDAAYFAAHTADFSSSLPDTQSVKTYAIGLGIDFDLLNKIAAGGGTSKAYIVNTAKEISDTLTQIVNLIITSTVSGAGAALAETFGDSGRVYRPRFQADRWTGNIDVSTYNKTTEKLDFQFDIADVLEARNLDSNPRKIIAGYDPDKDGQTTKTLDFSKTNASLLRPELFELFISGAEDPGLLETPIADYASNTSAETLISFIQGHQISGLRVRDRDGDGGTADLGDIIYSRPIEVGPKNGSYNHLQGYADFVSGLSSQPHILLVGANDGMLHAFDTQNGEELWAYIPSSQLKQLEKLSRITYNGDYRRSFVDGPISVEDVFINGSWHTIAMFGLRNGGSQYIVLDITNRISPSLIWEVDQATNTGNSWTKPTVVLTSGTANDPSSYHWYMVVGTGEGKTTAGTNILSFDLNSITTPTPIVTSISASDPAGTRTSSVTGVQDDADSNVDRLYLGTEEGDMYRVNVIGTPTTWVVQKLYNGANTHPIVAAPTTVLVDNPQYTGALSGVGSIPLAVGVYWGTGRYDTINDVTGVGATSQRIFGIFDPVKTTGDNYTNLLTNLTTTNLQNQSISSFAVRRSSTDQIYRIPSGKAGFYIDTATSISLADNFIDPAGMVFYEGINLRGTLLFSTFLPNQGLCAIGGQGFIEAVNFRTGGGSIIDMHDPSKPFYNGGVPDLTNDDLITASDFSEGIAQSIILPVIDAKVESINLGQPKPYSHSGTLTSEDIRFDVSSGGILPAVSSVGDRGAPLTPSILKGAQKLVVQPAYPVAPKTGTTDGGGAPGSGVDTTPSSEIPGPDLLPVQIYNLPIKILSFHESTGD